MTRARAMSGFRSGLCPAVIAVSLAAACASPALADPPVGYTLLDPARAGAPLRRGDRGAAVSALQRALRAAGWAVAIDGDFGGGTDAAVRAFQAFHRCKVDGIVGLVDTSGSEHDARYDRLRVAVDIAATRDAICALLKDRVPLFVYFNNYFRVRPRIHLAHLATRQSQDLLEDGAYDYGNLCLLKLLGFTAAELSAMGAVGTPGMDEPAAVDQYQAQLDSRSYQLNAASVRLTQHIRDIWQPDPSKGEAAQLRVLADGQYLKVVVEDALGVEIELDQRSEGLQWLVSFFVVFFAEAADAHKNAVLLLDEPGMSLHGLRQRDFRTTISKLAADNQTLFSTHSPFLVGPDELDKVRVVEMVDRTVGTKVHTTVTSSDPAALLPLQEALGYDLAQSLFAAQRNLVLEGLTDFWYLDATAQLLEQTLRRTSFPSGKQRLRFQDRRQFLDKRPKLGRRLNRTLVPELRLTPADHLAHRPSGDSQLAGNRLDSLG